MKILFVTTISGTVNGFLVPHIEMLLEQGHKVDIACNITTPIKESLIKRGCKVHNLEFQRMPVSMSNYIAYKKLKKLIQDEEYDMVHTHTPVASACTRLACKDQKYVKMIYTAHGFHFYKGAPLKNWLLFYPIERYLARYTDVLITINKEDYDRAKRTFKAGRVEYIPGVGLDTKKFSKTIMDISKKRREMGMEKKDFIILSVGELNKNKNHETVIKAVAKINNPNIKYVICGQGPLKDYLTNLSKDLGVEKQIKLLGYRKDIAEICSAVDIFAFPSKREGLGMAALEAMASGLPIITSNIHGIVDYSINGKTGFYCSPTDVDGFAKSIETLINSEDMRNEMGKYNAEIIKNFDIDIAREKMDSIYRNELLNKGKENREEL